MTELWEVNQAAQAWMRAHPQHKAAAFQDFYSKRQHFLQKQRTPPQTRGVEAGRVMERVLSEELARFPTHRSLNEAEVRRLIDNVSHRLATELESVMGDILVTTYLMSLADLSGELGLALQPARHLRSIDLVREGRGLAETFAGLEDTAAERIRETIKQAYESGRVASGTITTTLKRELGHELEAKLNTIARTESAKIWNLARKEGHEEAEEILGETFLYRFGPRHLGLTNKGNPQCDACTEAINRTRDGLPMDELIDVLVEVANKHIGPKWDPLRDTDMPVLHPNCIVGAKSRVLTEDGWKGISQVEKGEKVLTHKGRWKKVTHVFPSRRYDGDIIEVSLGYRRDVRVTEEHPFLVEGDAGPEWRYAKDLESGDGVFAMSKECDHCGELMPAYKGSRTCSTHCKMRVVIEDRDTPEWREKLSKSASKQLNREYADGTRDPFEITEKAREAAAEKYGPGLWFSTEEHRQTMLGENNPSKRPDVRRKISKAKQGVRPFSMLKDGGNGISPELREAVRRRDNYTCQFCGVTGEEFMSRGNKIGLDVHHVTPLRYRWEHEMDGLITCCRPCHAYIEGIMDEDWLSMGGAQFSPLTAEVKKYHWSERYEKPPYVYNLEVEDDESFVVKGFAVHNCRHVVPIRTGIAPGDS